MAAAGTRVTEYKDRILDPDNAKQALPALDALTAGERALIALTKLRQELTTGEVDPGTVEFLLEEATGAVTVTVQAATASLAVRKGVEDLQLEAGAKFVLYKYGPVIHASMRKEASAPGDSRGQQRLRRGTPPRRARRSTSSRYGSPARPPLPPIQVLKPQADPAALSDIPKEAMEAARRAATRDGELRAAAAAKTKAGWGSGNNNNNYGRRGDTRDNYRDRDGYDNKRARSASPGKGKGGRDDRHARKGTR
jgi:hypothetical protein